MAHIKRSVRGFSLVELAIVLGVSGLVLGTIWGVGSIVWANVKLARVQEQIQMVVQNARDYFGPSGFRVSGGATWYTDGQDITNIVNGLGLIPAEMRETRTSTSSLIHHALGTYSNGSFRLEARNGMVMRVRLLGLKQDECIQLLMRMPVLTPEIGVVRIGTSSVSTTVNLMNVTNPGGSYSLPLPLSTAQSWCSQTTPTNEVQFDFKIRP